MNPVKILHIEDSPSDAALIRHQLLRSGIPAEITVVGTLAEFQEAVSNPGFNVVLSDHTLPGLDISAVLRRVKSKLPGVPFICVTGTRDAAAARELLSAGAAGFVSKDEPRQLVDIVKRSLSGKMARPTLDPKETHLNGMKRLVEAVQELSLARDLPSIQAIVRQAAREITGADGATFVLRDDDRCFYADEDAISPLWKGMRFPMSACISGWSMLNAKTAVIPDIYADPRIPADAYRPTFVKSLVMVPIRKKSPIGAIGCYWASHHEATDDEVELVQALANTTSVAMENIQVYGELERRVHSRTRQLEAANRELEAFSTAISHDLRAPLRAIAGFAEIIRDDPTVAASPNARENLQTIEDEAARLSELIDNLLRLSRIDTAELRLTSVNLTELSWAVFKRVSASDPKRRVELIVADGLAARADRGLVESALENLVSNAWKYSSRRVVARIEIGTRKLADGSTAYFVRDNGTGFDPAMTSKLFAPFRRLHSAKDFPGVGIGLATVQRIVHRHGGLVWAEAALDKGATFFFTLPGET